jgi:hypothetical protein
MITDSEIRKKGIESLIHQLGEVEAERFITLVIREPFDYTEWQRELWSNLSVRQLSKMAMEYVKKEKSWANN